MCVCIRRKTCYNSKENHIHHKVKNVIIQTNIIIMLTDTFVPLKVNTTQYSVFFLFLITKTMYQLADPSADSHNSHFNNTGLPSFTVDSTTFQCSFVRLFVCSFVRLFVCSFVPCVHVEEKARGLIRISSQGRRTKDEGCGDYSPALSNLLVNN